MEDPNEADITPAVNILDISRDPPSIDEGKIATAKLQNGKATGIDQINAEFLKTKELWTLSILKNILQKIWESVNQMRHQLSGKQTKQLS